MMDDTVPIAIVGMSCRLPRSTSKPEDLWRMCAEQRDVWQPTPKERIAHDTFYHPDPARRDDHPGLFDAKFFNLIDSEARAMDPQQRLLLELSYEALENGGITLSGITGSDTAVFVGSSCNDYAHLLHLDNEKTELFQSTGTASTMLSNRISYFYDLKGASVTVDTACSSSLVALHLACSAMRAGETRMAIVGGSNLILSPAPIVDLSMLRFLSPDGRCYTYDERGNGFGRGEGAACLVLKLFEDALKDGDTIRAVIRNSGTNQDGKTLGITLPSGDAQVELMERTYRAAGLDPAKTSYVEAHGTGTLAGDPIEAASLSRVFAKRRPADNPLTVGSIKSNIGHLEGGSGIAGVVKVVLMLENSLILPNFDFQKPSNRIPMHEWNIKVPTCVQHWPTEAVHRASVNNFGFGGSNGHVIVDDAYGYMSSRGITGNYQRPTVQSKHTHELAMSCTRKEQKDESRVFILSASNEHSLRQQEQALGQYLRERQDTCSSGMLCDLAYTLGEHRSKLPRKSAFVATSLSQLAGDLTTHGIKPATLSRTKTIGFIFTGQGAQWHAMGRELIAQYQVFRTSLDLSDQYVRGLGISWSLLDELLKDAATSRINNADMSQTLTTAIQIGLVDLFAAWNIRPARVVGHSSGEIAAAYCVGALTQEAAITVAYHRGRVALKLKDLRNGAMLAVGLSEEQVKPFIMALDKSCVKVACVNSPSNITLSGDKAAICELAAVLQAQSIFTREVAVDVAYHSHHMEDVADEYRAALRRVSVTGDSNIEFHSSVRGKRVHTSELGPEYWVLNMVNTVQFSSSMQSLLSHGGSEDAIDILVELGPHSALRSPVKQILQHHAKSIASEVHYSSALLRDVGAVHTCHTVVAELLVGDYPINLNAVNFASGLECRKVLVDLPPYVWDHSVSYWAETAKNIEQGWKSYSRSDILGVKARDSTSTEPQWRNILRPSEIPWVNDHVVQGNTLYPAAGFIAMAIEAEYQHAITRCESIKGYNLREVTIGHALIIPHDAESVETILSLRPFSESLRVAGTFWDEFCISSSVDGSPWTENCRGLISVEKDVQGTEVDGGRQVYENSEQLRHMVLDFEKDCTKLIDTQEMYKALEMRGLSFGPTFTNLQRIRASSNRCCADVSIPNTASIMPAQFEYPFIIHPATLDSCIHAVFPIGSRYSKQEQGTPVPTFIEEMYISQSIGKAVGHVFTVYAQTELKHESLVVFDKEPAELDLKISINGLVLTSLANETQEEINDGEPRIYYQTDWQPDPSFLSSAQVTEITATFCKPLFQDNQICVTEQAAFYYAESALKDVAIEESTAMQPHHQKLYASLTGFCNAARSGQLGRFSSVDWLCLNCEQRAAMCARVRHTPCGTLLWPVGENLSRILRGEISPLSVLVEDDRLERFYRTYEPLEQCYQQAATYIGLLGNKNPHLNVLEIGAGTGGATLPILEGLSSTDTGSPKFANYDFTDLSPAFFDNARKKLAKWSQLVTFKSLNIESDLLQQGYEPGLYDVIVAANIVHATSRIESTMKRIRSLLKPGGTLVLIESTVETIATTLIFGTLPGWWSAEEKSRVDGPLLTDAQWEGMLHTTGFTGPSTILWDMPDLHSHVFSTIISTVPVNVHKKTPAITIVVNTDVLGPCAAHLQSLLVSAGIEHNSVCLSECDPKNRTCVVLCELTRSVLRNPVPGDFEAVKRVFLESSGVLWVTAGALVESGNPDLNLVTGLARTTRAEKGDSMVVTLDLDFQTLLTAEDRAGKIFSVVINNFCKEDVATADVELEYVERNGTIMIPRIIQEERLHSSLSSATGSAALEVQPFCQNERPLKAEIRTPGLLDSIHFVTNDRMFGNLPKDYVEVQVKASGVNFKDVMTAMGQISAYPLGFECSGVVSAVGEAVEVFRPGDRVIATVPDGSFCNVIRASAEQVELVPDDIPFNVAAALPVVYYTAHWAVFKVARLNKDESVLIHAASGGLGQALINLCQHVGAQIFATVGTLEKKHLLMYEYNIPKENIFSSRDAKFAKGIMRATAGKGVDVIMNSLSGEALRLSWSCIAPFGRFVELGKRDFTINSRLEMRHFQKNVSFTGVDVPLDSQRGDKRRVWGELMALYKKGSIVAPRPITVFGISELEKALRIMQTGKHLGKMVLMPQPDEMVKVASKTESQYLRDDASYLLIGGLGGIGRATAIWMLEHGARHFIFASPSGADKEKARETIELLRQRGAQVSVFKCDISTATDLDRLLEDCGRKMPPIRGMIHAALVSKADLFAKMNLQDYNAVMRPKVDGIWNLHHRLSKVDIDFFIMLSSLVGLTGDPSQAAYVSASVFQDAFAEFRNRQGLPAVTLDLGKVIDIGIVAESSAARRAVKDLWSRDLYEEEVMSVIKSAILVPLRTRAPGSRMIGLKAWSPSAYPVFQTPLFSHFRRAALGNLEKNDQEGNRTSGIRESLTKARSLEEAAQKACENLISKTSSLLMIPVDNIDPSKSISEYGMDSLVAVEMRNWLLREFEVALPIIELLSNVSLQQLSLKVIKGSKLLELNHLRK